jgi:hypothetical protein
LTPTSDESKKTNKQRELVKNIIYFTIDFFFNFFFQINTPSTYSADINSMAILEARLKSLSQSRTSDVAALRRRQWLEVRLRELGVRLRRAAARERNIQHLMDVARSQRQADTEVLHRLDAFLKFLKKRL